MGLKTVCVTGNVLILRAIDGLNAHLNDRWVKLLVFLVVIDVWYTEHCWISSWSLDKST